MATVWALLDALSLSAGYNASLVAIGALLLGIAAGVSGTFLFLRKRALVSDAVAHATLPGIACAFAVMVMLGGDGRALGGLLIGAALSATLGLFALSAIVRHTRLPEDAAIGAVLSVSFGIGVVALTGIQTMEAGRQAGLEGFLLGSTAGMLYSEAVLLALGALTVLVIVVALRRPMTLVAFDPAFAASIGTPIRAVDLAIMGVVGLKIVGLVLVVALLIIPPVSARFWTDRTPLLLAISGAIGGMAGYVGAAISSIAPALPTGAIIVLVAFALFLISLIFSPHRGLFASFLERRRFQVRVHRRQGLLALGKGEAIYDPMTLSVLRREGLMRRDGVVTDPGRAEIARARLDEARWMAARTVFRDDGRADAYDGLSPADTVFTPDQIEALDAHIGKPRAV